MIDAFELGGMEFEWQGRVRQTAIPAGSTAWFDFSARLDPGDAAFYRDTIPTSDDAETLQLTVSYSDIDGRQRTRTEALVRGRRGSFRIDRVSLIHPGDAHAFMELSAVPEQRRM